MRRRQAFFTLAMGLVAATGGSQTLDEIVARHVEARGAGSESRRCSRCAWPAASERGGARPRWSEKSAARE